MTNPMPAIRLAVDIGGTFVDAMELDTRTHAVRFRKAPTTPARPWEGVLTAVELLGTDLREVELFIHGTTLGLNAVLERRGETTGIIANEGFRDIFLLGRGNVPPDHPSSSTACSRSISCRLRTSTYTACSWMRSWSRSCRARWS